MKDVIIAIILTYLFGLTLILRDCLGLTQIPAPNNEKYLYLCKKIHLQNANNILTKHLPIKILAA